MVDIHVTLPDASAGELDRIARDRGATRNALIRLALEQFFESTRKRAIAEQMHRYAAEMAEASGELVRETDRAVAVKVLKETRW
ncbi:MAG: ribbon-helix-helix protein, CopG family [Planctomycetes bacterium]|nr:ribbon-helix-helix protein, CopG family [Planctomycetota bacterium]